MKAKFYTRLVTTGLFVVLVAGLSFSNRQVVTGTIQKFVHREYTFSEAKDAIAADYPEELKQKYFFVNLNGLFVASAGQRICNNVVKLNNGTLYLRNDQNDLTPEIERTVQLNDQLEDIGIDFVYVLSPTKMDVNNELMPSGLDDYANSNADQFIAGVTAEGVDVLDLRKDMADTPEHIEEYFYRTDHHWTPIGAFKGFQEISEYLQELYPEEKIYGECQHINSGFRCQALNKAVGGVQNSYHTKGRAVDIPTRPGWLAYIRDHLPHTELINEGTWIHVAL